MPAALQSRVTSVTEMLRNRGNRVRTSTGLEKVAALAALNGAIQTAYWTIQAGRGPNVAEAAWAGLVDAHRRQGYSYTQEMAALAVGEGATGAPATSPLPELTPLSVKLQEEQEQQSGWKTAAVVIGGAALLAGGVLWVLR